MSHYGFDVSSNNPHPINWAAAHTYLSNLGGGARPFVIVKITQGTEYVNPFAQGDVAAARAAGFAVAGYLMLEGNENVGAQEAAYRAHAGSLPQTDDIELPGSLTPEQYAQETAQLLAANPHAIVYYDQSEVEQEGFPLEPSAGLWLAQYNNTPGVTSHPCTIHQYSDAGNIPGCAGQFDLDVWLGTEAAFDEFFNIVVPKPPAPKPTKPPVEVEVNLPELTPGLVNNNYVKAVQAILAMKFSQKLGANGNFGSETIAAVENIQRFFKLPVTGVVDQATWGVLLAL